VIPFDVEADRANGACGVAGAVKGTLAVMVACPKALFADLEPMLKHLGKVFFIGERPGMGQTMKLANNFLSATALAATSEAIVFGVKAGLDPATMIDVINADVIMPTSNWAECHPVSYKWVMKAKERGAKIIPLPGV